MKTSSHSAQSAYSHSTAQADLNTVMGCAVLLLPVLLWLTVAAHRKHRASKLGRQIQKLERLWLLSLHKPTF